MSSQPDREPLRLRLRVALITAMKTHDATAVAALRSALGAIDNAEAVDVSRAPSKGGSAIAGAVTGLRAGEAARRDLSEHDMLDIVRSEVAARQSAASEYERLGRRDDADRLRAEADVLRDHLDIA